MNRCWLALLVACCGIVLAQAGENNGTPGRRPTLAGDEQISRLIVGTQVQTLPSRSAAAERSRVAAAAARSGLSVRAQRAMGRLLQLLELDQPVGPAALAEVVARLASDPDIAFVEPDRRVYAHALPADTLYAGQWYLQAAQPAALDAESAWDQATGSPGTVVAVIDTGVRFNHPDLLQAGRGGRLLPGYDFVSADPGGGFRLANDGDGWDGNPSDPGDWISSSDAGLSVFAGCEVGPSSWHGTRVAGLLGAITNNGAGIAGTTWSTWILPVRVLGKCYGFNSDILQGMRWAAGLHVDGVPDNPYPAKILNISLGGNGSCTASYRSVIDELAAAGVLVVASAGNSGAPVEYPANCPGVAAVGGLRHIGTKVGYSNLGPAVALSAPAGNCVNLSGACLFSLDTTYDLGATVPATSAYTNEVDINVGTSFSVPFVAGIAALMQSVNGNLRGAQLTARLQDSARPFPPPPAGVPVCHVPFGDADIQDTECGCTTSTCGAGMAHAPGALSAALRPIAAIIPPAAVAPGQDVVVDASGSAAACSHNIVAYQWSVISGSAVISGADTPVATVIAPTSGAVTLRVTVTDDHGALDTAQVTLTASSATTVAPATAGDSACLADVVPDDPGEFVDDGSVPIPPPISNSGGGGTAGIFELGLLVLAAVRRVRGNRG